MSTSRTVRARLALAGFACAVCSMGCISSTTPISKVRYEHLDPDVKTERGDATTELTTAAVGSAGSVSFTVTSQEECTVTTRPRYRAVKIEGHEAEHLAAAYTIGGIGIVGGGGTALTAWEVNKGSDFKNGAAAGFMLGGLVAVGIGLIALPVAIYHTSKAGVTETPGEITYGTVPGAAPAPATPDTKTSVCNRHGVGGVPLSLVLTNERGDKKDAKRNVVLGRTSSRASVTEDVPARLREALPGWPEASPLVNENAVVVRSDKPSEILGTLDLNEYPGIRYGDHVNFDLAQVVLRAEQSIANGNRVLREGQEAAAKQAAIAQKKAQLAAQHAACVAANKSKCSATSRGDADRMRSCMASAPACN